MKACVICANENETHITILATRPVHHHAGLLTLTKRASSIKSTRQRRVSCKFSINQIKTHCSVLLHLIHVNVRVLGLVFVVTVFAVHKEFFVFEILLWVEHVLTVRLPFPDQ